MESQYQLQLTGKRAKGRKVIWGKSRLRMWEYHTDSQGLDSQPSTAGDGS